MRVPRLYIDASLRQGVELALPDAAARHLQVLRLQPGDALTLFDGRGGEWGAELLQVGRREVRVCIGAWHDVVREPPSRVTLAIGMPANERMDLLVEKATELGAASFQPLECERAVLRLSGERAGRKRSHWQGIAIAAAEQSGRTCVPSIEPVRRFGEWLAMLPPIGRYEARVVLSLRNGPMLVDSLDGTAPPALIVLGGPEGGLTQAEEAAACDAAAFVPCTLGTRVLRADTAPLAALAQLMTLKA